MAQYGLIHGEARRGQVTPEWIAWHSMRTRCFNPKCAMAKHYSERGISVCSEWQDPVVFLRDMGPKPSAKHTLGRINNDEGYSKQNCRWETSTQQNRNRRSVKLSSTTAEEIRELHRRGFSFRNLGRNFGVNKETVRKIVMGLIWKNDHE